MSQNDIDPVVLRRSMRCALDLVAAHRIAKGLTLDVERMTAIREALEDRLTLAFAEVDLDSMSSSWSMEKAAETLSVEIALQILHERQDEPRDPAYGAGA